MTNAKVKDLLLMAEKIATDLKKMAGTEEVYLYGSLAKGTANEESDIDPLIFVKENVSFGELLLEIIPYLRPLFHTHPLDARIFKRSVFEKLVTTTTYNQFFKNIKQEMRQL